MGLVHSSFNVNLMIRTNFIPYPNNVCIIEYCGTSNSHRLSSYKQWRVHPSLLSTKKKHGEKHLNGHSICASIVSKETSKKAPTAIPGLPVLLIAVCN